jgi:hypothetical protein
MGEVHEVVVGESVPQVDDLEIEDVTDRVDGLVGRGDVGGPVWMKRHVPARHRHLDEDHLDTALAKRFGRAVDRLDVGLVDAIGGEPCLDLTRSPLAEFDLEVHPLTVVSQNRRRRVEVGLDGLLVGSEHRPGVTEDRAVANQRRDSSRCALHRRQGPGAGGEGVAVSLQVRLAVRGREVHRRESPDDQIRVQARNHFFQEPGLHHRRNPTRQRRVVSRPSLGVQSRELGGHHPLPHHGRPGEDDTCPVGLLHLVHFQLRRCVVPAEHGGTESLGEPSRGFSHGYHQHEPCREPHNASPPRHLEPPPGWR